MALAKPKWLICHKTLRSQTKKDQILKTHVIFQEF